MEYFTPLSALFGGSLIGLGAILLFIGSGRIAGISGIASNALFLSEGRSWRLAFIIGVLTGPLLVAMIKTDFSYQTPTLSGQLLLAGLLVGLGTGWGTGCTSGHGICGISRLSVRSVTATLLFMLSAMFVATILR